MNWFKKWLRDRAMKRIVRELPDFSKADLRILKKFLTEFDARTGKWKPPEGKGKPE